MSLDEEQAAIQRRQRIAEALMQQGQMPLETNQVAGGYVVPVSPLAGVAKVAQSLAGAYMGKKADEEQTALAKQKLAEVSGIDLNSADAPNKLLALGRVSDALAAQKNLKENKSANRYQPTNQVVLGPDGKMHLRRYGSDPDAAIIDDVATLPNDLQYLDTGSGFQPVEKKGILNGPKTTAMPTDKPMVNVDISQNASPEDRAWLEGIAKDQNITPNYAPQSVGKTLTPDQQMKYSAPIQAGIAGAEEAAKQEARTKAENQQKIDQAFNQKSIDAKDALSLLDEAEPLLDKATGSGIGAGYDAAAKLVGYTPSGAEEAASLEVIGGMLISKMPKMTGPQSDKDVLLYTQMAGKIGDRTVPAAQKRSAIKTIRAINNKYAEMEPQSSNAKGPKVGDIDDGHRFKGGNPSDPKNWEVVQ